MLFFILLYLICPLGLLEILRHCLEKVKKKVKILPLTSRANASISTTPFEKKISFETIIMCLLRGMWDFSINQLFCQILEDMDIVIECNCVIFRWLLLNSKCAKSIFENLVNRHLMIFTHSHSKSRNLHRSTPWSHSKSRSHSKSAIPNPRVHLLPTQA